MVGQSDELIQVLLDGDAEFGDRHDAAMDLSSFEGNTVEEALMRIACDKDADEELADACGESLAEIWCRKNRVNEGILVKLVPASMKIALATLRACSPMLAADADRILSASE